MIKELTPVSLAGKRDGEMTRINSYLGILALMWVLLLFNPHLSSEITRYFYEQLEWGFLHFLHAGALESSYERGISNQSFLLSGLFAFCLSFAICVPSYLIKIAVSAAKNAYLKRTKSQSDLHLK